VLGLSQQGKPQARTYMTTRWGARNQNAEKSKRKQKKRRKEKEKEEENIVLA